MMDLYPDPNAMNSGLINQDPLGSWKTDYTPDFSTGYDYALHTPQVSKPQSVIVSQSGSPLTDYYKAVDVQPNVEIGQIDSIARSFGDGELSTPMANSIANTTLSIFGGGNVLQSSQQSTMPGLIGSEEWMAQGAGGSSGPAANQQSDEGNWASEMLKWFDSPNVKAVMVGSMLQGIFGYSDRKKAQGTAQQTADANTMQANTSRMKVENEIENAKKKEAAMAGLANLKYKQGNRKALTSKPPSAVLKQPIGYGGQR